MRIQNNRRSTTGVVVLLVGAVALAVVLSAALARESPQKKKHDAAADDDGAPNRIVPGKRIGKLSVGMTIADVFNAMGDPTDTSSFDNGNRYRFGKTSVFVSSKTSRVIEVETEESRFATAEGVSVGDSGLSAEAKLGTPEHRTRLVGASGVEGFELWYRRCTIDVRIDHGTVTYITVFPSKC